MMSKNTSLNVRNLLNHIDSFAPFSLAEEWDNPGLIVGSYKAEVKKIAVCLDAFSEAVIEADKNNCNVIVTHHPLIFRGIKKVEIDSEPGRTINEAIKRDVNIIAAHTNWDKADEGVNFTLANLIGLQDCKIFEEIGFCGNLKESMNVENFVNFVKSEWGISKFDVYSQNVPEKISRVALCGGSGAEFWRAAKNFNADIYLTADMKYHELIDATHSGLSIGLLNHGEMERASLPKLASKISEFGIETILLNVNALPFRLTL